MNTPYIVVSLQTNIDLTKNDAAARELAPRIDYMEITRKLRGELIGRDLAQRKWYRWIKPIEKKLRIDFSLAGFVAANADKNNIILSASEKTALPLAIIQSILGKHNRHVVIAHKLSTGNKTLLLHMLDVRRYFDQVITLCKSQADYAVRELHLSPEQVHFIYDKVDEKFWNPSYAEPDGGYILAVGQEQRDYATLAEAVEGTGLPLVIVASSPWSTNYKRPTAQENITVKRNLSYVELRRLYAGARLVVVPLNPVDYAAGANGVLEAMSMGKALILTRTVGIQDYVIDGKNGVYVPAGDTGAMREAILQIYNDPALIHRLGSAARARVEEKMTIDRYVNEIAEIVLSCC